MENEYRTIDVSVGDPNYNRDPKTDFFCCNCQKDIKKDSKFYWAHIIGGGTEILHPEDEAKYDDDDGGNMDFFPIGPECAGRFGLEWFITDEEFKKG